MGTFPRPFVASGSRRLTLVPKTPRPEAQDERLRVGHDRTPQAQTSPERREAIPFPGSLRR